MPMKSLYTRWGKSLCPDHVLEEYPRPLLHRNSFCSLNGYWNYRFLSKEHLSSLCKDTFGESANPGAFPNRLPEDSHMLWDGKILVPFSPESLLSGVNRQLMPEEYLWYERPLPAFFSGRGRLLLHFGAVDQSCRVFINQTPVGDHHGGYLPFTIDITDHVTGYSEPKLQVLVSDPSDTSWHARGKQKLQRGGMYYTAQSGIWQTVWLEEVPDNYITKLSAAPDADHGTVVVQAQAARRLPIQITIYAPQREDLFYDPDPAALSCTETEPAKAAAAAVIATAEGFTGEDIPISLQSLQLWDCDTPWLYRYCVKTVPTAHTEPTDYVDSYFAFRTFTIEKDEKGIPRICLNHRPQFQRGVLDQGYWSDGLYTAPADAALVFDILSMKKLGYNMIRKHIKIEPQRWYYHCDRLGMVVWQDMVNGGTSYADWYVTYAGTAFSLLNIKPSDRHKRLLSRRDAEGREEFAREVCSTIALLKQHPSIAVWVIFNEGWGQFETEKMTALTRTQDPTRLIDAASGWFDQGCGDLNSFHNYFFPMKLRPEKDRAAVLSEFGGYSMAIPDHVISEELYGYGTYQDTDSLQEAFENREAEVNALIPAGLCASVYTQVSDVEDEVNGIFTYDREIQKLH